MPGGKDGYKSIKGLVEESARRRRERSDNERRLARSERNRARWAEAVEIEAGAAVAGVAEEVFSAEPDAVEIEAGAAVAGVAEGAAAAGGGYPEGSYEYELMCELENIRYDLRREAEVAKITAATEEAEKKRLCKVKWDEEIGDSSDGYEDGAAAAYDYDAAVEPSRLWDLPDSIGNGDDRCHSGAMAYYERFKGSDNGKKAPKRGGALPASAYELDGLFQEDLAEVVPVVAEVVPAAAVAAVADEAAALDDDSNREEEPSIGK